MKSPVVQECLTQYPVMGFGLWSGFVTEPIDCDNLRSNSCQDVAMDARAMLLDLVHNSFISVQWDGPDGQKRNLQGCTFYWIAHRTCLHPWTPFSSSAEPSGDIEQDLGRHHGSKLNSHSQT